MTSGSSHGLLLKDGDLYVVGYNSAGQLGFGDLTTRDEWTNTGKTGIQQISAGAGSSYLLLSDGRVESSGYNLYGQLGIGTFTNASTWTDTGLSGVSDIYGAKFNLYVIKDNDLLSVGSNLYQQLGAGPVSDQSSFVDAGLDDVNELYTDRGHHFVYAKKGSEVWQIGLNNGQLGTGDIVNADYWTKTALEDVDTFALGDQFALYLKDGDIYGTGINNDGQLALGTITNTQIWTQSLDVFDE